ncbi:unnamed protein product [Lactuca saligna]|uniref:VQ domain-containing protein n=1 Tax=Lactuca saligna TaxID=75948 RepID=A0AA35VIM7_LACSI|nr:unnamed protein product [Lactuca saligna]
MDQSSCYYASPSSSFSYSHQHPQKVTKSNGSSYVKKPITKPFIAPMAPNPTKVYNVDSCNFKEVVRLLTSSSEFQNPSPRYLKAIAPPPLDLSTIPKPSLYPKPAPPQSDLDGGMVSPLPTFMMSPDFCKFLNETLHTSSTSKSPETDHFRDWSPVD